MATKRGKYVPERGDLVWLSFDPLQGVVLSDQLKSLDWVERKAELIATLPSPTIVEILRKASLLVSPGR